MPLLCDAPPFKNRLTPVLCSPPLIERPIALASDRGCFPPIGCHDEVHAYISEVDTSRHSFCPDVEVFEAAQVTPIGSLEGVLTEDFLHPSGEPVEPKLGSELIRIGSTTSAPDVSLVEQSAGECSPQEYSDRLPSPPHQLLIEWRPAPTCDRSFEGMEIVPGPTIPPPNSRLAPILCAPPLVEWPTALAFDRATEAQKTRTVTLTKPTTPIVPVHPQPVARLGRANFMAEPPLNWKHLDYGIAHALNLGPIGLNTRKAIWRERRLKMGGRSFRRTKEERAEWKEMKNVLAARARGEEDVFEGRGGDVKEETVWDRAWEAIERWDKPGRWIEKY